MLWTKWGLTPRIRNVHEVEECAQCHRAAKNWIRLEARWATELRIETRFHGNPGRILTSALIMLFQLP